jgi:gamma-glutamyltranspeptidase/glutathione hydrolase
MHLLLLLLLLPGVLVGLQVPNARPEPVRAPHGMVASAERRASQVGADTLKAGGNAVDAAVAVAFALAVTYPEAGNLGGGGFMLIHFKDGKNTSIDYRETAPGRATHDMYLDAAGQPIQGEGSSTLGYRAVGVPGTVAGMWLAKTRYGSPKVSWAELVEPARRLAADGFPVTPYLAGLLSRYRDGLGHYRDSRRILLKDGAECHSGAHRKGAVRLL